MGTDITLQICGLDLDYSKNARGTDHGMLFQASDRKRIHCDCLDYEYFQESGEDPGPMEMAFSKPLRDVLPRLALLGFTLEQARLEYDRSAAAWREECNAIGLIGATQDDYSTDPMTFEEFRSYVTEHPLHTLDDTATSSFGPESDAQIKGRFGNTLITQRLPRSSLYDWGAYSERSYFASLLIGILHPYSLLRIFAENPANLEANVVWQYGLLVENGWAAASEFNPCARRGQTFLVATEGSSDAHILKHAFDLLRPEIVDFFRFIDVSERHPFSGAGNLLKFAEGLAKIDVQNQIVFLFDNDAEGFQTHQRLLQMSLPPNMGTITLPESEYFRSFSARGPEGVVNTDINRRAAAIECYLDLELDGYPPAQVTWTSYKKDLDDYQGALEHKETYTRRFMRQTRETISSGSYNVARLHEVLNALVAESTRIASQVRNCGNLTANSNIVKD